MFREVAHVVVPEHLGLVNVRVIPGFHLLVSGVRAPFANVQHGGVGAVGVIDFQQVALPVQVFRDFFQGVRRLGAQDAMEDAGLVFDDKLYGLCNYDFESAYHAMNSLLARRAEFTALFAMSDVIAFGAIRALVSAGMRVPEDVSVIGFDGITMSRYCVPVMTTIVQPSEQIALQSIELLVRRGVRVIFTTQVPHEGSDMETYRVGFCIKRTCELLEASDMTVETVYAKTMWAMANASDEASFRRLFLTPVGEDIV